MELVRRRRGYYKIKKSTLLSVFLLNSLKLLTFFAIIKVIKILGGYLMEKLFLYFIIIILTVYIFFIKKDSNEEKEGAYKVNNYTKVRDNSLNDEFDIECIQNLYDLNDIIVVMHKETNKRFVIYYGSNGRSGIAPLD